MFTRFFVSMIVTFIAIAVASPAAAQCPPSPPGTMTASDGSVCNGVFIDWSAVSGATSYEVWRNTSLNYSTSILVGVSVDTEMTDLTALPGTQYYYWVRAFRVACIPGQNYGNPAGPNAGHRGTSPPVPANLSAFGDCFGVHLEWDAVSHGNPLYQVWRNTSNNYQDSILVGTSFDPAMTDLTVLPGTTYYYWVRTTSLCGNSGPSNVATGARITIPPAPSNLVASDDRCVGVNLTWSGELGLHVYDIWRNTVDDYEGSSLVGVSPVREWLDVTAAADTTYYYWVRATTVCGASDPSNMDTGRRIDTPNAPAGLTASQSDCLGIDLDWGHAGGSPLFEVWRNTENDYEGSGLVGATVLNHWRDLTPLPDTMYYYWIRATTACGNSGPSNLAIGLRGGLPDNDSCDSAASLPALTNTLSGDLTCALPDGSSTCDTAVLPRSVWYRYQAPSDGGFTINTCGTYEEVGDDMDPVLSVHSGCPGDEANQLACSDDDHDLDCHFFNSRINLELVSGQVILIRVTHGFMTVPHNGQFILNWDFVADPPPACPADFDNDGFLTGLDFDAFVAAFESGDLSADFDEDGFITGLDFDQYVAAFEAGC